MNGEKVREGDKKLLDKNCYKKGDDIYCRAKAVRGIYASKDINSREITIANAAPIVDLSPVDRFQVPGRFQYTIAATDPDNDTLSYHLLSPLEVGIDLHPETGKIVWDIHRLPKGETAINQSNDPADETGTSLPGKEEKEADEKNPFSKLSSVVKIVFEVRDEDDATVVSAIILNLAQGEEIAQ
ncbi:MAG: hypothetical protein GY940_10600 [bacterium]|nr:hypothetical protein [bacterium]